MPIHIAPFITYTEHGKGRWEYIAGHRELPGRQRWFKTEGEARAWVALQEAGNATTSQPKPKSNGHRRGRIVIPPDGPRPKLQNRAFVEAFLGELHDDELPVRAKRRKARRRLPARRDYYLAYMFEAIWYHPETRDPLMKVLKRGVSTRKNFEKRLGEAYRWGADTNVLLLEPFDTDVESLAREAELHEVCIDAGGKQWADESYFIWSAA